MDNKKFPTRKRNRLENFDYSQGGSYFVTICAKQHQCIFGNMNVDFSKSLSGLKVLLVEDNELNMEIAKFILENAELESITMRKEVRD